MALTEDFDYDAFSAVVEAVPDRRVELLYGEIHVLNRPILAHQAIQARATRWLEDNLPDGWMALPEIELHSTAENLAHRVVPDITVLPQDTDLFAQNAPLSSARLVVEIHSPTTRERDLTLKSKLYARAGVAWYWTIDPDLGQVTVRQRHGFGWDEDPDEVWPGPFSFADLDLRPRP